MNYYLSNPVLALYDGEGDLGAGELGLDPPVSGQPAGGQPVKLQGGTPKVFTQDDVNRFLADDRRKHKEKQEALESAYKEALENKNLTDEHALNCRKN